MQVKTNTVLARNPGLRRQNWKKTHEQKQCWSAESSIKIDYVIINIFVVVRPHRSTTYVDAAYCCDRVAWSLGRSVCLSVSHTGKLCKNGRTDRDAIWVEDSGGPKEPCIRWGPDPLWKGAILRGKGRPIVKYMGTLRSSVQKRWNQSRCRLGGRLGWAVGIMC